MGLLTDLLTRPFRRQVKDAPAPIQNRRGSERIETTIPVSLRKLEMPPFAGSLINISMTGAAISLHGWNVPVPVPWPTELLHGDELALTGLLIVPLNAWVVSVDEGVMRVRFLLDSTVRAQLHQMITNLAELK